jgi:hypothetical protein
MVKIKLKLIGISNFPWKGHEDNYLLAQVVIPLNVVGPTNQYLLNLVALSLLNCYLPPNGL